MDDDDGGDDVDGDDDDESRVQVTGRKKKTRSVAKSEERAE